VRLNKRTACVFYGEPGSVVTSYSSKFMSLLDINEVKCQRIPVPSVSRFRSTLNDASVSPSAAFGGSVVGVVGLL